jgi:hypothetical protein
MLFLDSGRASAEFGFLVFRFKIQQVPFIAHFKKLPAFE